MSPQKPVRNTSAISKDGLKKPTDPVKDLEKPRPRERRPRVAPQQGVQIKAEPIVDIVELHLLPDLDEVEPYLGPPKTPAPDLFSPTPSTEPSAARSEARAGTPPPTGATDGTGRPSRRARAAVNYAEPNLISKMRRPTKEFIPAVIGDSKRAVSTDAKSAVKDRPIRTVIIKREEGTESSWKNLPPAKDEDEPQSPSAQKAHSVAAQRSTSEARIGDDQETIPKSSASGAAISALMSSRRGTVSQATPAIPYEADEAGIGREDEDNEQAMAKRMQEMDLYDFKDSSPADGGQAKAPIKSARRHSSVPKPETAKMGSAAEKESARRHVSAGSVVGVTTGTVQAGRSERAAARRKSMML